MFYHILNIKMTSQSPSNFCTEFGASLVSNSVKFDDDRDNIGAFKM